MAQKKSFLERLTGSMRFDDDEENTPVSDAGPKKTLSVTKDDSSKSKESKQDSKWEEEEEAQLTVDVYQSPADIVVQTMVAGVLPENLSITITRDMITIKGKREENRAITDENYFVQELYWGAFSRTISLPEEVDPEEAEAIEKHGLLIIKLPKVNKDKETKLKVKSI